MPKPIVLTRTEREHIAKFMFGDLYYNLVGRHRIAARVDRWPAVVGEYRKQRTEHDQDMRRELDLGAKILERIMPKPRTGHKEVRHA